MFLHESLLSFDINIFSIVLLGVLWAVIQIKKDIYRYSTKLLKWIIGLTMLGLIVEPITWLYDPSTTQFEFVVNVATNYLLPLISPVLIGVWGSYLDYKIFENRKRLRRRLFYMYPTMATAIVLMINAFTPIVFTFVNQTYQPVSTGWLLQVVMFLLYGYFIIFFYFNRPHVRGAVYYGVFAFFMLPIIGSIIQYIEPTFFFAWPMLALCAVVVYIFLETTTGIRDYLTKLYSRRTLEDYMMNLAEASRRFIVVMIDLNDFKTINDSFGHQAGDTVLIEFSQCLKKTFNEEKLIARYGGDEFFVVVEKLNPASIQKRLTSLRESLKNNLVFKNVNFTDFSVGMSDYDGLKTIDEIFLEADQRMYNEKPNS